MWFNVVVVFVFNLLVGIGDGKVVDVWILVEVECIVCVYGNYLCFMLMVLGNELGGLYYCEYLVCWVMYMWVFDGWCFYMGVVGWLEILEN